MTLVLASSTLSRLPTELFLRICTFLPIQDVAWLAKTCKRFRQSAHSAFAWHFALMRLSTRVPLPLPGPMASLANATVEELYHCVSRLERNWLGSDPLHTSFQTYQSHHGNNDVWPEEDDLIVAHAEFVLNGHFLITCSCSGTVRLWNMNAPPEYPNGFLVSNWPEPEFEYHVCGGVVGMEVQASTDGTEIVVIISRTYRDRPPPMYTRTSTLSVLLLSLLRPFEEPSRSSSIFRFGDGTRWRAQCMQTIVVPGTIVSTSIEGDLVAVGVDKGIPVVRIINWRTASRTSLQETAIETTSVAVKLILPYVLVVHQDGIFLSDFRKLRSVPTFTTKAVPDEIVPIKYRRLSDSLRPCSQTVIKGMTLGRRRSDCADLPLRAFSISMVYGGPRNFEEHILFSPFSPEKVSLTPYDLTPRVASMGTLHPRTSAQSYKRSKIALGTRGMRAVWIEKPGNGEDPTIVGYTAQLANNNPDFDARPPALSGEIRTLLPELDRDHVRQVECIAFEEAVGRLCLIGHKEGKIWVEVYEYS